jgi:hypothetical protein
MAGIDAENPSGKKEEQEEEEEFKIESVIGERVRDGRTQFLLRWRSFDPPESTWGFDKETNCSELIYEFRLREAAHLLEKQRRLEELKLERIESLEELHEALTKLMIGAF